MESKLLLIIFSVFFKFLGTPEPQSVVVLLQNNHEIRATGGFLGSYAKIEKNQPLLFQDIYVPDGQIKGHVEPPLPIQQAFGQGWFRLRDANWSPNYPTTATSIRWFFEKGEEINPNVLIAINLSTIEKILKLTGPLELDQLNLTLDSDNISLILQNQIQQNFFPGSTNKKDLIAASNQALQKKLSSLKLNQKLKILSIILKDLENQEILINSQDQKFQTFLERKNWAGVLKPASCKDCLSDTVSIVESNLGSNKANSFITRHTSHEIRPSSDSNDTVHHQITIYYQNSSPSKSPNPPNHHGGDYINYLRIYIPANAQDIRASNDFALNNIYGFTEIGFFHTTTHQSTGSATLSYHLPLNDQKTYQLSILKQPGIGDSPQSINLFNETIETNPTSDFTTFFDLQRVFSQK